MDGLLHICALMRITSLYGVITMDGIPMNLEKIVAEALGHDASEEWAELVSSTVKFTIACYHFDQALRTYKKKIQEQKNNAPKMA